MRARIGTSGFDYPHWRLRFYPRELRPGERLAFYARTFDTVELDVTFYRMPTASALRSWRDSVPAGFTFAVKASRFLTHIRRLRDPREPVEYLMERASLLDDRLGPILLQLPPDMTIELDRLAATLESFPASVRVAVEPRHPSWFTDDLRQLLTSHRAALCLADRGGLRTPLWQTADWSYVRLHEGRATPRPCYGRDALRSWADRIERLRPPDGDAYVYFNNDARACAIANARTLREMVDRAVAR
jgi:uncharacterized protein YecE (DUF72 family)